MSLASTAPGESGSPEAPQHALQAAHTLLAAGDYAGAFARIRAVVAAGVASGTLPATATALSAVARAAERSGDEATARQALEVALALADWADVTIDAAILVPMRRDLDVQIQMDRDAQLTGQLGARA